MTVTLNPAVQMWQTKICNNTAVITFHISRSLLSPKDPTPPQDTLTASWEGRISGAQANKHTAPCTAQWRRKILGMETSTTWEISLAGRHSYPTSHVAPWETVLHPDVCLFFLSVPTKDIACSHTSHSK